MKLFRNIPNERLVGIVIDMQPESYLSNHDPKKVDALIKSQIAVLKYFRENNHPVINIKTVTPSIENGPVLPEILEEIEGNSRGKNLDKRSNSGLSNSELEDWLGRWGRDHLFLMGVNAYACVKATAEDALSRGYDISVSWDLVANPKEISPYKSFPWFFWNSFCFSTSYEGLLERIK